jgi:hypothetical protein
MVVNTVLTQGLDRGIPGALEAPLGVGGGEGVAVVPLDALAHLEHPRRLALELPLGREAGVELAVWMPAHQVVEEVEGPADLVGRRAEMGIEVGDVSALADDELLLLGRLRPGRAGERAGQRNGRAGDGRSLDELTTGQVHGSSSCSVPLRWSRRWDQSDGGVLYGVSAPRCQAGPDSGTVAAEPKLRRPIRWCMSDTH